MSKQVLYLCDHKYNCANSLFCELNGGDCKHTCIAAHSRNHSFTHHPETDPRFEAITTGQYYDEFRVGDNICYIEKEDYK